MDDPAQQGFVKHDMEQPVGKFFHALLTALSEKHMSSCDIKLRVGNVIVDLGITVNAIGGKPVLQRADEFQTSTPLNRIINHMMASNQPDIVISAESLTGNVCTFRLALIEVDGVPLEDFAQRDPAKLN